MDPNEALDRLRQLVADMNAIDASGEDPDESGEYRRIASEATDAFGGLDHWLSRGGYLPRAWVR